MEVRVSYLEKVDVSFLPESRGAFGELTTDHLTPIVQIANKYQIDPANLNDIEIFEATGGSADNSGNLFRCQTGTSLGGYGVIRSKETINYRPGQGVEAKFTAAFTTGVPFSLQFGGMFSLTETLGFGYDGADFSVLHSYGGAAEVQLLTVTASGTGSTTITLDGDSVNVTTAAADSVQTTAEKLRAGLAGDATLGAKWRFEQVDDKVFCISRSVGDKTGTMSTSGASTVGIAEQTAGVAKTDNHTAQSAFNVQAPFSGFDPTKLNVYKIQFGYLGVANISFFIMNPSTGIFELVHQIEWGNTSNTTHLGSPNLKMGWTAASLGSTGTNLTVTGASGAIFLQGDEVIKNNTFADVSTVASIGAASFTNLITIKNRIVYGDRFNLGKVFPLLVSVDNEHNKGLIVEIFRNPTVAGTTNFQYEDEYNSLIIADKSGTTVTGGTLIDAFVVAANASEVVDLTQLRTEILPEETFVIAAETVSGTATNTTVGITWKEEK
jgi:hypothetical protein